MGIIGNFLADQAGNIGEFIDKKVFGGSGNTGRSVGSASSSLLRLLPFENGGVVMHPVTGQPIRVNAMQKGGMVKPKKKAGKKKAMKKM